MSACLRERRRTETTTILQCRPTARHQLALTAVLLGLMLLAPPPLRAASTPASDRQEPPGLVWPVEGKVTSRFGPRGFLHVHRGVDIRAPKGTPVHAAAGGTVAFSGRQSSYGRVIKIDHPNGLRTIYAHNSRNFVKAGERVKAGAVIGAVGQSGRATTNHLHFEVRRHDVARDPLPLLRSRPRAGPMAQPDGSHLRAAALERADGDLGSSDGAVRHGHLRAPKSHPGPSAQLHSRRGSTPSASCHTRACGAVRVKDKAKPIGRRDT